MALILTIPHTPLHLCTLLVPSLQHQILKKRRRGLSYRAIAKDLSCARSTVYYYCNETAKEKKVQTTRSRRRRITAQLKAEHGAQCVVCGYDRCPEALEFDHLVPSEKRHRVSSTSSLQSAQREAAKCVLLCCRCHRERHAGLLDLGAHLEPSE